MVKLIQQRLLGFGAVIMALFVITIYLSTSLAIIVSVLVGLLWLLTFQFKKLPAVLKASPVATWALLLYLCFIAGLSYTDAPSSDAFVVLRKYRELLYIPVLSCFFTDERYRTWAWRGFLFASVLTLLSSYIMDFGLMGMFRYQTFTIKSRIAHSIFMSFFIFFCAHKMLDDRSHMQWYLLSLALGIYNIFFLVDGRSGQLIFIILMPLFAAQRFGRKGLLALSLVFIVLFMLFFNFTDESTRFHEGIAETQNYFHHTPEKNSTSMGHRFSFWENSLKLIAEKPWLGFGTGGFEYAYHNLTGELNIENPHNEFLLITVQFGIMGLLIYLGFLSSQFFCAKQLPDTYRWLAQGLLVSLIITSLFNSPFLDHTEGHWFAVMIALCFAPLLINKKLGST